MRGHYPKETHAVLKFKHWLSILAGHPRNIENATDWLIHWEKKVIEEQPSSYARLQKEERRVLTRAGRLMLRRYIHNLEMKGSRTLGTRSRQEALERFIYFFARYLIPILKRSSVEFYRTAVEYALKNVVLERSAYVGDPEFFHGAENTLEILKSANSLGLGTPSELYLKCEAALAPRTLKVQDIIASFRVDWDQELVKVLEDIFGNRPFDDASLYDALMMAISKLPEHRLSRHLESHGIDRTQLNVSAAELLSIANHSKWIQGRTGEPRPLFFLLKWYFSGIRNLPHHKFASYTSSEVRDTMLVTNYVLKQIDGYATERHSSDTDG